jgi:hypothetical protein
MYMINRDRPPYPRFSRLVGEGRCLSEGDCAGDIEVGRYEGEDLGW